MVTLPQGHSYEETRVRIYNAAVEHFPEYAITGVGAGTFWGAWGVQSNYEYGRHGVIGAHSVFIQVTIYWGLAGLLALMAVVWQAYRCLPWHCGTDPLSLQLLGLSIAVPITSLSRHSFYAKEFSRLRTAGRRSSLDLARGHYSASHAEIRPLSPYLGAHAEGAMTTSPGAYSNLSGWLRCHALAASLIVLFCATCPRVFLAWRADLELISISDASTYLWPARNLIEWGAFLAWDGTPEVTRTPGYSAFLAVMMFLIGQDLRLLVIVQAIILSFGVLLLYRLASRILPPVMAFSAGLLAAFSPWSVVSAASFMTEGLFLTLLTLIFLAINLLENSHNSFAVVFGGAWVGLLTAAAVLVRPLWPLVILVAGSLLLRYGPQKKGVWLLIAIMLACAFTPLSLWKARNYRETHFDGLSDISGITTWRYLASRVKAQANGEDRWALVSAAMRDEDSWRLSIREADDERWRRIKAVFLGHPILTVYCFFRSAAEHIIHPSPGALMPYGLNFYGDFLLLALLWGGLLILACVGWRYRAATDRDNNAIDHGSLLVILVICLLLTLSSGISFGAGSRLRVPLELIVPLLASIGLVHAIDVLQGKPKFKRR